MLFPADDSTTTFCMSTIPIVGATRAGPSAAGAAAGAAGVWARTAGPNANAPATTRPAAMMRLRMKDKPLEMRSEVEVQNLALVQALLEERIGKVDTDEAERRLPGNAYARRGAEREVVEDTRLIDVHWLTGAGIRLGRGRNADPAQRTEI